ncbi:unnamed protein product [Amoebophrya sp. A120]|nr:unnamed protein product [Amoebophrya sp. A120]|eukprot:GSA120T00022946001.1
MGNLPGVGHNNQDHGKAVGAQDTVPDVFPPPGEEDGIEATGSFTPPVQPVTTFQKKKQPSAWCWCFEGEREQDKGLIAKPYWVWQRFDGNSCGGSQEEDSFELTYGDQIRAVRKEADAHAKAQNRGGGLMGGLFN